jgi:hypothetical protein
MITVKVNSPQFAAMKRLAPPTAARIEAEYIEACLKAGVSGCRYIGTRPEFKGRTALIRRDEKGILVAQFDFKERGVVDETDLVCYGWHAAFESDWDIVIEIN